MKQFVIPFLALCVAGLVAFEITYRYKCSPGNVTLDCLNDMNWLTRKLSLDARQAAEIAKLHAQYRQELETTAREHCAACCGLRAIILETNSDERVQALIDKMSIAQKESELATVRHIRQVYGLLNKDQKQQFEQMVKLCIGTCGANGKCAGNCEAGTAANSRK